MKTTGRLALRLVVLGFVLIASRLPLHLATHSLPVSNDDAIPLLMARHILKGEASTVLWNQPYNGALDAYLLAPGLMVGSPHAVFRGYEALCALALVAAVGLIAERVHGQGAAWGAALLASVGSPYMALMAATGPPPNFLVPLLVSIPLLLGLRAVGQGAGGPAAPALSGLVCGVAVWDSALALPALIGVGAGLLLAGLRPRPASVAVFLAGLGAGLVPLAVARLVGASAASPVTALRPRWLWADGLADLFRAARGLLGLEVPLVIDGPEREALPAALRWLLASGLVVLVGTGITRKAAPLLGWAAALAGAFAFSRRTGGDEVRYLYGLAVPVLVLAGAGLARLWAWRRPAGVLVALAVAAPWAFGHRLLAERWRDPAHAARVWQVPPLGPTVRTLERVGVRSAYASLQFAGRLTLESAGKVIASQAWNERVPGDPLRFRDEVDLDPRAAWVLSPHLSRGMPRAAGFRDLLKEMGGTGREDVAGDLVVFRGFRPPFDEARPLPVTSFSVSALDGTALPAAVRDRDAGTTWTASSGIARGSGLAVRVSPPRRVSALVLGLDPERAPLAVPWVCEADGAIVARGPLRHGLQWVNGVPRAGRQALLAVPLGDRPAGEVRLIFQDAGLPLTLSEVFLYGPDEATVAAEGAPFAAQALEAARRGDWDEAVRLYAEAVRLEPDRAAYHAGLARSRWRAAHRRRLDVESLDDGGAAVVQGR